ncbi:hypothetical protein ACN38_g12437, partial [Penicillium nordicum]
SWSLKVGPIAHCWLVYGAEFSFPSFIYRYWLIATLFHT